METNRCNWGCTFRVIWWQCYLQNMCFALFISDIWKNTISVARLKQMVRGRKKLKGNHSTLAPRALVFDWYWIHRNSKHFPSIKGFKHEEVKDKIHKWLWNSPLRRKWLSYHHPIKSNRVPISSSPYPALSPL